MKIENLVAACKSLVLVLVVFSKIFKFGFVDFLKSTEIFVYCISIILFYGSRRIRKQLPIHSDFVG